MVQRLSGADAAFIYLETPAAHMHVAMTGIYDVSTIPGGYDFAKIRELMEERSRLIPPFRRRLVEVPLNLNHPIWVEDPDFDIDFHLKRVAVRAPGGRRELADLAAQIASTPLDRKRPLWEAWIIEGLKQDRLGFVCKVHHAAIDGVSGAEIMTVLYDLSPEGREFELEEQDPERSRVPSDTELIGHALKSRAKRLLNGPALVGRTIQGVSQAISNRLNENGTHGALPLTAPRTPFNGPISRYRRVSFARIPLGGAKFIKNTFGVKLNDVVLAIVSDCLSEYLEHHDALPDEPLIACCPISVRSESESGDYNNRVSAMFTNLETNIDDPVERLMAIATSTAGAKEEHNAIGAETLTDWTEWASPRTFGLAARLYSQLGLAAHHRPIHNLVISNVPGPPIPLYFAGAKLVAAYPMGPIMDGAGLNVTVLSYEDQIDVGFMADRDMIPDVWELAKTIGVAYDALLRAAEEYSGTTYQSAADEATPPEAPASPAPSSPTLDSDGDMAQASTATAVKTAPAKKAAARKAPAKTASTRKSPAKKAAANKAAAKKSPAKKAAPKTTTAKKAPAKKAVAKNAPAKATTTKTTTTSAPTPSDTNAATSPASDAKSDPRQTSPSASPASDASTNS